MNNPVIPSDMSTPETSTTAADATTAPVEHNHVVMAPPSVRAAASQAFSQHAATEAAAKATRQKKVVEKKVEKKPEEKDDGAPKRIQSAVVAGTFSPPARAETLLRAELLKCQPQELRDLLAKIKALEDAIRGSNGADKLEPARAEKARMVIAQFRQAIKDKDLDKYRFRVSEDAPAALAVFIDWLITGLYDVVASNTLSAGYHTLDMQYLFSAKHRPEARIGGLKAPQSPVGPFISNLPSVVNYDQEHEDALKVEHTAIEKAKKAKKAEKEKAAAEGGAEPAEKVRAPRKRADGVMGFATAIQSLIVEKARNISEDYKSLRTNWRAKELFDLIAQEAVVWIARKMVVMLQAQNSLTVDPDLIKAVLRAEQFAAHRSEDEIASLQNSITCAVTRWNGRSADTKAQRKARELERYKQKSDAERAAHEAAQRAEREARLNRTLASQLKRAGERAVETGSVDAESLRVAEAAALEAAAAAEQEKAAAAAIVKAEKAKAAAQKKAEEEAAKAAADAAAAVAATAAAPVTVGDLIP